ncbi:hypothetical protein HO173_005569 [Letharia columbiana]|uniref:Uncharacterized protein n=1 Tax=Letharia columbiana TaxID=112416 RepID=A0A8H6L5F6_9LECA|nr:uncharacterized protein HO173_005569 [Letharia columbiana]KAF6236316.1 hypothetical protein HO173_005569 [Letharia columbiana]
MLRKWETEQHGVLEEGPDYWSSQANKHWQGKMWILVKELGKRKKQELEGEAEEGKCPSNAFEPTAIAVSTTLER